MNKGLSTQEAQQRQAHYGHNVLHDTASQHRALSAFASRFKSPLVIILLCAATLSFIFGDHVSGVIIVCIVTLSIGLDFFNSYKSEKAAQALKNRVRVTVTTLRDGAMRNIFASDLVPGDIVSLSAGKMVPADGEIVESNGLFANESALTGESFPQSKPRSSTVFMGSGIISGSGLMKVTDIGSKTKFSHIAAALQSTRRTTEFEREIKSFSVLIVKITAFLVIFVFGINLLFQRDPLESILFSLALAVGLTPELLPLIITLNLTKGSLKMAKAGVVVKQLSAVQNFGSMNILCTDKTGTLTEDKITLVKYTDGEGNDSSQAKLYGYLVSYFSTGFENPLDTAVESLKLSVKPYQKVAEIPFDFERKRESVAVYDSNKKHSMLIVKGAPEEIFKLCTRYNDKPLRDSIKTIRQTYDTLSQDGLRVVAIATKPLGEHFQLSKHDEQKLEFLGFLAFLDPAKQSVSATLKRMNALGISVKIITGDNLLVTEKIAREINLSIDAVLTGDDIEKIDDRALIQKAPQTTIFARVNPEQKMRIIQALQESGATVGYMGDGINDAPSLRAADIGISVNNATDIAKDAADFILLHKSLGELTDGVVEGRKTFANTMKYLRMSLSSNFGNMFSMAAASLFLPFLPMKATQILLNNLLYDCSQFALPLDTVDADEVKHPRIMHLHNLKRFMWMFGILSSLFDLLTFFVLIVIFQATEPLFQVGWFIESILTQILVIYIIRTKKLPLKSRPAPLLVASTLSVIGVALVIVLTPIGGLFGFALLGVGQLLALLAIVIGYLYAAELLKRRYYRYS